MFFMTSVSPLHDVEITNRVYIIHVYEEVWPGAYICSEGLAWSHSQKRAITVS